MTTPFRRFLLVTCAHAVVTLCLIVYAASATSARFDHPDVPVSRISEAAGGAADVLSLPGRLLWTSWASQNLPNAIEWAVFLANSALWSFGILGATAIVSRTVRLRRLIERRPSHAP